MANYLLDQTGAEVQAILNAVQAPDTTPVEGSTKLITSGGVQAALAGTAQELNAEVAALGQEIEHLRPTNLTGFVAVDSIQDLPDPGVDTLGYLIGTNLYLYVGTGGDTLGGKYQNAGPFRGPAGTTGPAGAAGPQGPQGPQGPEGPQGNTGSSVDYPYELVNNLKTNDPTKALSAAMGKKLGDEIYGESSENLIPWTPAVITYGNTTYTLLSFAKVLEGDIVKVSLNDYANYKFQFYIQPGPTYQGGTLNYDSGARTADFEMSPTASQTGWLRLMVWKNNSSAITLEEGAAVLNYAKIIRPGDQGSYTKNSILGRLDSAGKIEYWDGLQMADYPVSTGYSSSAVWNMGMEHLPIPVSAGEKLRITFNGLTGFTEGLFSFLTADYQVPTSASQVPFTEDFPESILIVQNDTNEVVVPDDAAWLILRYYGDSGMSWTIEKFVLGNTNVAFEELKKQIPLCLKVATWNIGHFSLGGNTSSITHEQYPGKRAQWASKLNDFGADILGMQEFCDDFVNAEGSDPAISTDDAILGLFPFKFIGPTAYIQQAICSTYPLNGARNLNPTAGYAGRIRADAYINISGKSIRVMVVHFDTTLGTRATEIEDVIRQTADDQYVIILGDMNAASISEYDPFVSAGFTMANGGYLGSLPTWDATSPSEPADNIVCRGFAMKKVETFADDTMSDHCALLAELVLINP